MQPTAGDLKDTGVLVTRPAHQSQPFVDMLQQAGARVIACPTVDIQATNQTDALKTRLEQISSYDILIFISANAVSYALKSLTAEQIQTQTIAAIGQSTQRLLAEQGLAVTLQPRYGFTTEHLLELEQLQAPAILGKHILIFRGEGGREQLADTLINRGARVDYAEVYRRTIPRTNIGPILEQWANGAINLVTVTSNQILENLYYLLTNRGTDYLNTTALIVPGKRCFELALKHGHNGNIQIASSAMDKDMFQAVLAWHDANKR